MIGDLGKCFVFLITRYASSLDRDPNISHRFNDIFRQTDINKKHSLHSVNSVFFLRAGTPSIIEQLEG